MIYSLINLLTSLFRVLVIFNIITTMQGLIRKASGKYYPRYYIMTLFWVCFEWLTIKEFMKI